MDVSICIATCRRPIGLARLLESLSCMKVPDGVQVEILVVDNDPREAGADSRSGDRPERIGSHPVRWLVEPRRNIAHARNRAVGCATGEWLAFVDDDEWVDGSWLTACWDLVGRTECDGCFGPVMPDLEPTGATALDLSAYFDRERFATGATVEAGSARTGNAFVRRALFRDLAFDPEFGRTGGEDAALFGALRARGADFRWCDEAVVRESVPAERQHLGWLARRFFRGGCTHVRVQRALGVGRLRPLGMLRSGGAACGLTGVALLSLARGREPAVRALLRAIGQLGQLWGHLGGRYAEYEE